MRVDAERLGAGVRLSDLAAVSALDPARRPGLRGLQLAARSVASPLIRNVGTVGGNLCVDTRCNYYNQTPEWRRAIDFCKKAPGPAGVAVEDRNPSTCWVAPSSPRCWAVSSTDLAPALSALGARVVLRSRSQAREIDVQDLFADDGMAFLTKARDELITEIRLPALEGDWRSTWWKIRRRGSIDFAVLSVAAALRFDGEAVVEGRLVLGAVASRPVPVPLDDVIGGPLDDEVLELIAGQAARSATPLDNTDFTMSWRRQIVSGVVKNALRELRGDPVSSFAPGRCAGPALVV